MSGLKSVNNAPSQKSNNDYVQQMRDKIGEGFTDQVKTGKKRNELGKDDFMKLMTAQLKYQDPMSPMKNEEMAAQLAQFSSLEQMTNVNTNLEKMTAGQKPQENMIAASLIGKRVASDSSHFSYDKKTEPTIKFELPTDAKEAEINILDAKGEIVRTMKMATLKQGPQAFKWNGKSEKGLDSPEGDYSFRVVAKTAQNQSIPVNTGSTGLVSGVVFEQGKAMLIVDDKKIPLEGINRIEDDTKKSPAPAAAATANPLTAGEQSPVADKAVDKQNVSTTDASEKNNENISPSDLQAAIKTAMIKDKGALLAKADAPVSRDVSGGVAAQDVPMPLWNPANN